MSINATGLIMPSGGHACMVQHQTPGPVSPGIQGRSSLSSTIMIRPQPTIGWCMIAIAIIGYFCAFPELATLLGIFIVALLFLSPVALLVYGACWFLAKRDELAERPLK